MPIKTSAKGTTGVRVKLIAHNRQVRKKVERDLYWYDHGAQKMQTYRGTRLLFEYDRSNKRTVVKPVVEELSVYRNSWEDIESILESHKRQIDIVSIHRGHYVVLDIEDDYFWYDIEKQLRNLAIRWEMDEDNS